jgi:cell division protein FtsL
MLERLEMMEQTEHKASLEQTVQMEQMERLERLGRVVLLPQTVVAAMMEIFILIRLLTKYIKKIQRLDGKPLLM